MDLNVLRSVVVLLASLYGIEVMTYLTEVWELSFTHAAAIINVFQGGAFVLVFATQFLAEAVLGNYWVIVLSHLAFTAGLCLLAISTPPILSGVAGNCSAYKAECVGPLQKTLFYTGLPLIAVGISCHVAEGILTNFFQDNSEEDSPKLKPTDFFMFSVSLVVPLAGFVAIGFIDPWWIEFAIPAIGTAMGTVIFLVATRSFKKYGPKGGSLTRAVKDDETKELVLVLVALSPELFVQGIVSSVGSTFFIAQADQMSRKVGRVRVPSLLLRALDAVGKTYLSNLVIRAGPDGPVASIAKATLTSVLSCITAAKIEQRRLDKAVQQGLVGSNGSVSMTMFWLLPQFMLLGAADDISRDRLWVAKGGDRSVFERCSERFTAWARVIIGAGTISGVLVTHLAREMSGRGGKGSWFQQTLNMSRLDNYYWTLAVMAAVNLVVFYPLSILFMPKEILSRWATGSRHTSST